MAIRITNRDLDIMLTLARNGFATIDQIQNKWFPSYKSCVKRLLTLRKNKYVKVDYVERHGKGIYSLTNEGLAFINDYCGYNYKNYSKSSRINHFILCSEFYLNFPYKILEYEMEYYLEDLIPDIYVKYYNHKEVDLLVEIDNTGRKNIIKSKIDNYNNYLNTYKWRGRFDLFPKCLIATKNNSIINDFESKIPFTILCFNEINRLSEVL